MGRGPRPALRSDHVIRAAAVLPPTGVVAIYNAVDGEAKFRIGAIPNVPPVTPRELFNLSDREDEMLVMIWEGLTTKEMAARLGVKESTAREYKRRLQDKVGADRASRIISVVTQQLPQLYKT